MINFRLFDLKKELKDLFHFLFLNAGPELFTCIISNLCVKARDAWYANGMVGSCCHFYF